MPIQSSQDEIEIGYSESPTHIMPVVFDGPRDRKLDDFPEKSLLGPDFGHLQIGVVPIIIWIPLVI